MYKGKPEMLKSKRRTLVLMLTLSAAFYIPFAALADNSVAGVASSAPTRVAVNKTDSTAIADVSADPPVVEAKKAKGGFWIFGSLGRLESQVATLQKQLARLTIPLDKLEPGTLALDLDMNEINAQTKTLLQQLGGMQVDIKSLQAEITTLRQPISELKDPVARLEDPVTKLQGPISAILPPLLSVSARVVDIQKPLVSLDGGVRSLGGRFNKLDTRFVGLNGRFTELDGRFTELDGRFTELDGRFTALDHRFENLDKRFINLDHLFSNLDGEFSALGTQLSSLQSVLYWIIITVITVTVLMLVLGVYLAIRLRHYSKTYFTVTPSTVRYEEPTLRR
jgi:predicted nuclease with TOPRIM domain